MIYNNGIPASVEELNGGWRPARLAPITFVAGTTGATGFHALATPSDDIDVAGIATKTTTNLSSGGAATLGVGTENTALWSDAYTAYVTTSPFYTYNESAEMADTTGTFIVAAPIGYTIADDTITGGVIEVSFWWRPRVPGATLSYT